MQIAVAFDTSVFIEKSITSVYTVMAEALALVVLVIFFFLRSFRATLIPFVTIPVSLIGAFFLIWIMGFSINVLTLLGIVLAVGLVVDDAIVVLENIHRHVEDGMTPVDAALKGGREIAFAVVAMTVTLGCSVRTAGVFHRQHRAAVPRVRAHRGVRGGGVGFCRADADADDVLEAAAP